MGAFSIIPACHQSYSRNDESKFLPNQPVKSTGTLDIESIPQGSLIDVAARMQFATQDTMYCSVVLFWQNIVIEKVLNFHS